MGMGKKWSLLDSFMSELMLLTDGRMHIPEAYLCTP